MIRSPLLLVAAVGSLTVGVGLGTLPAIAQTTVRQSTPSTSWNAEFPRPAAGLSTWMATFADPTAGPGQAAPEYAYFLDFSLDFFSSAFIARGRISLDVVGNQKFATLSITEAPLRDSRSHRVRVPFPWQGNSFYFLWVNRLADGLFGGWVYDVTAATWTYIGAVLVPPELAVLDTLPSTGVEWTGPALATCDAYPEAVMVARAPTAYRDSTPMPSVLNGRSTPLTPADCPSTAAFFVPGWDYYVAGSAPPAAAAAWVVQGD